MLCSLYSMSPNSQRRIQGRGSGDEEAATTPFFFEILYHFYRILSLYSWQVSRPPLSEFSGSAPANVCMFAITCAGKSTRPLNSQSCFLCHLRKTKQIQQWRWKLVKATSPILSHLLPATQAQGTSLIGWNGNFLCKFGERGDDQLSELEHFMINKR